MRTAIAALLLAAAPAAVLSTGMLAGPADAQQMPSAPPGKPDPSLVTAGTYKVDPEHTQVVWEVDHMGLTPLYGTFGQPTGTLTLDPANPSAAKVNLTFPMSGLAVPSPKFTEHLNGKDFLEVAKYPQATFVSTSVKPGADGRSATITGNMTMHGVTKPVTLNAKFYGAGTNPMSKALNVGFTATGKVKRSDFGLGMGVPIVSDEVDLLITAGFEKQ